MILVDLHQIVIAAYVMYSKLDSSSEDPRNEYLSTLDEFGLLRHMILSSLCSYAKQFKADYGPIIICTDSKKNWRKDYFKFYKAKRAKDREESIHDWKSVFERLDKIKEEFKQSIPYKLIEVEGAEADDIIGALVRKFSKKEKILIVSADGDFKQLHVFENVEQWNQLHKKFVRTINPREDLFEHIVKGDRGDGVPNILSPDNVFLSGARQKPVTQKKLDAWKQDVKGWIKNADEDIVARWQRNRTLIDLSQTPVKIQEAIYSEYEKIQEAPRDELYKYLIEHQLKLLMPSLGEF